MRNRIVMKNICNNLPGEIAVLSHLVYVFYIVLPRKTNLSLGFCQSGVGYSTLFPCAIGFCCKLLNAICYAFLVKNREVQTFCRRGFSRLGTPGIQLNYGLHLY
jgi:hypothetical protein